MKGIYGQGFPVGNRNRKKSCFMTMRRKLPYWIITATSIPGKSQRTVSLKTLPRYGWAETTTSGVSCAPVVVDEKYITGDASDYEKFCKWAECLGKAIGNPLFHWSHLELQRYFGYNGVLNKNTADEGVEAVQ